MQAGDRLEQDPGKGAVFANIQSGVVSLTRSLPDGRQQIVGLQFAPSFVGRPFVQGESLDVLALSPVRLCSFSRTDFERLLQRNPDMERRLLRQTLDQLDEARAWLMALGRKTALERVASFLIMLTKHCTPSIGDDLEIRVSLPLSRGQMADFLGLTIETVSRKMTVLRNAKVIDFSVPSTVQVLSPRKLMDASTQ